MICKANAIYKFQHTTLSFSEVREIKHIKFISVDAKLVCKHKGLIPDSNVKACQPI